MYGTGKSIIKCIVCYRKFNDEMYGTGKSL